MSEVSLIVTLSLSQRIVRIDPVLKIDSEKEIQIYFTRKTFFISNFGKNTS
jgi:hypothetical protein